MGTMNKPLWMRKAATLSILPIAALGVAGCNEVEEADPAAVETEDIYIDDGEESDDTLDSGPFDEVFDQSFYDEINIYFGEQVTLAAEVNEALTPHAFALAGADGSVVDPLLVVHAEDLATLEPGTPVVLTGQVEEYFDVAAVEEELGVDLDDAQYAKWDNEPYLAASAVEAGTAPAP